MRPASFIALACVLLLALLQLVPTGREFTRPALVLAFAVYVATYLVRLTLNFSRVRRTRR